MILATNPLPLKSRLKELLIDYLAIVAYLVVLFGVTTLFWASLVRNCVKFLPWQLGHVSTIRGIYTNYDSTSIWISFVSLALLAVLLLMTPQER